MYISPPISNQINTGYTKVAFKLLYFNENKKNVKIIIAILEKIQRNKCLNVLTTKV